MVTTFYFPFEVRYVPQQQQQRHRQRPAGRKGRLDGEGGRRDLYGGNESTPVSRRHSDSGDEDDDEDEAGFSVIGQADTGLIDTFAGFLIWFIKSTRTFVTYVTTCIILLSVIVGTIKAGFMILVTAKDWFGTLVGLFSWAAIVIIVVGLGAYVAIGGLRVLRKVVFGSSYAGTNDAVTAGGAGTAAVVMSRAAIRNHDGVVHRSDQLANYAYQQPIYQRQPV